MTVRTVYKQAEDANPFTGYACVNCGREAYDHYWTDGFGDTTCPEPDDEGLGNRDLTLASLEKDGRI